MLVKNINKMKNKFVKLNKKFNSRSHACQELDKMQKKGEITDYIVSWDAQLRMVVEVVFAINKI